MLVLAMCEKWPGDRSVCVVDACTRYRVERLYNENEVASCTIVGGERWKKKKKWRMRKYLMGNGTDGMVRMDGRDEYLRGEVH